LNTKFLKSIGDFGGWLQDKFSAVASTASCGRTWFPVGGGNFLNLSKQKVNNDSALTLSPWYAGINAISGDTAKLPVDIQRSQGERRLNLVDHTLHRLLNFQANPLMDAMTFRQTILAHAIGWGNGYAEIQRDALGNAIALWLLRPDMLSRIEKTKDGRLIYEFSNTCGGTARLDSKDVFHVHGLGYDGIVGYNVVRYAAESIGLGIAAQKFGGAFFGNGCNQSGSLTTEQKLSEPAQERLRAQIKKHHGGVEDSNKLLVLEEGLKFEGNLIPPDDAQFLQTRQFQVIEVARFLRIQPHKLASLERSTFSNIEHQNIDYVTDSLDPWIKRFELEVWNKLFTETEQSQGYYAKLNVNALLRGDVKTRSMYYKLMLNNGVMSINEVRALEDMNPIENGDIHFVPMNMLPLERADELGKKESSSTSQAEPMVENIAGRLAKAECSEVGKHIAHRADDEDKFNEWMRAFYKKHDKYVENAIAPLKVFNADMVVDVMDLTLKTKLMAGGTVDLTVENRKQYIKAVLFGALKNV
jgi:HK97 family phage portal protein